jgi:hypothetical protein
MYGNIQGLRGWIYNNVFIFNYYVFGHYPSSRLLSKSRPVYISKHNVSETGFYLPRWGLALSIGPN